MFIFYVDESGSSNSHKEPLEDGQTPIFVLAALAVRTSCWRTLDRSYQGLKKKFFSAEVARRPNRRVEAYEVKGNDLIRPGNRTSRRRHVFMAQALELCRANEARGFAVIFRKNSANPVAKHSQYNMGLQYMVERFDHFLEETSEGLTAPFTAEDSYGIIIADSRMKNLDMNVATSHLSFIFGHTLGSQCRRVVEAPTFTSSELSVGVQLTDIFASALYAQYYRRHCAGIGNASDYSHMKFVDDHLEALQWRSSKAYDGYFMRGYRFLDHSVPP
jgi:hypothetical protein